MKTLLIACGALAREIRAVIRMNGLADFELTCLPAELHNRPERIPEAVRSRIKAAKTHADGAGFDTIFVVYGDCGTGGKLDAMLAEEGVERIAGPHCYAFFAGLDAFEELAAREPGTFYLTDFLARHFDRLVIEGLGLDRHPELQPLYFGNYRRLVYLAQSIDPDLDARARAAATRLGLEYSCCMTGYVGLETTLSALADGNEHGAADHRLLARHPGADHRQVGPAIVQAAIAEPLSRGDRPGRNEHRPHRQRRLSRRLATPDQRY